MLLSDKKRYIFGESYWTEDDSVTLVFCAVVFLGSYTVSELIYCRSLTKNTRLRLIKLTSRSHKHTLIHAVCTWLLLSVFLVQFDTSVVMLVVSKSN